MEGGIKAWSTSASTESWLEGSKLQCDMDVAPKALLKVVRCLTVRWDVTFRAVPIAKLVWNVPLAVESVEASVLICMRT